MGMDCYAHLAFGIKLPKEFEINDDDVTVWEALDTLFDPYDKPKPYPLLELVTIGSCDDPEFIVACKSHVNSVSWLAESVDLTDLNIKFDELCQLGQFAIDFDINTTAQWYLGIYTSY